MEVASDADIDRNGHTYEHGLQSCAILAMQQKTWDLRINRGSK